LARQWAGKHVALLGATLCALLLACGFRPEDKPLNPRLLFTSGSAFLDSSRTAALKGKISFEGGKIAQSGSFQLFLAGRDSLSFLVEGPLGADIFRMIIAGDSAYLLSNKEEGWVTLHQGEVVSIDEFGIENISPFLLGLYAFPQYFLHSTADSSDQFIFENVRILTQTGPDVRQFLLVEPGSMLAAAYGNRKNRDGGYYPSFVKIFMLDHDWDINLRLEKILINPDLPEQIWQRK
jgi:hypothetical protein